MGFIDWGLSTYEENTATWKAQTSEMMVYSDKYLAEERGKHMQNLYYTLFLQDSGK